MGRLGEHLRFFIRKKVAEDKDWQKPRIIFSGESWCVILDACFTYGLVAGQMEVAEEVMRKDRNVLHKLAQ